jgi:predicted NBD/HSP70 family sugar kinase
MAIHAGPADLMQASPAASTSPHGVRPLPGLDPRAMRKVNASTVLDVLYRDTAMTLAVIAGRTGLSRRTVEQILLDLEQEGWVRVLPAEVSPNRGRPARLFAFRPDAGSVLAISIAHDHSSVTVADLQGDPIASETVRVNHEPERDERIALTRAAIDRALSQAGVEASGVKAVTIATPGNVNDLGQVDVKLSMRGWTGFSLAEEFGPDFTCPVNVENDAKLAVRGELWQGATPGADHVVWLMLAGVHHGLGIAVDGRPYRGVNGAAGETTWAQTLGFDSLGDKRLGELGDATQASLFAERASVGDADTLAVLDELSTIVARGLSSLAWVLAPRFFVLGGSTSTLLGELLLERVRESFVATGPDFVDIRLSSLGESAITVGAIRRALDEVEISLFSPLS